MVGVFTKFSYGWPTNHPRHGRYPEDRFSGNWISPIVALNDVLSLETFEAVEHPSEPVDSDLAAPCPPPERCIMQDSLIWKKCSWAVSGANVRNHDRKET